MWALYNLVLFYQATKDKLKAINPLRKFLCIKLVVFFTFWQEVLIALLVHAGAIDSARFMLADWTNTELANGVDNFVICFEMLIFSIAHIFVFPPDDCASSRRRGARSSRGIGVALGMGVDGRARYVSASSSTPRER